MEEQTRPTCLFCFDFFFFTRTGSTVVFLVRTPLQWFVACNLWYERLRIGPHEAITEGRDLRLLGSLFLPPCFLERAKSCCDLALLDSPPSAASLSCKRKTEIKRDKWLSVLDGEGDVEGSRWKNGEEVGGKIKDVRVRWKEERGKRRWKRRQKRGKRKQKTEDETHSW